MAARRPHTELYCHLVWATWDRTPWITAALENRLFGAMRSKLQELGCSEITLGGAADHVHVVCRYPPVLSISELVQKLKGSSSHFMTHGPGGEPEFQWQGGYGAFSLGRNDLHAARQYVLNQKQHHATGKVWAAWERIHHPD